MNNNLYPMETREKYRNNEFYKESIKLIKEFINDTLENDIERLKTYCFKELKTVERKYRHLKIKNWNFDCDDTALARAIYCVVWGYVFNLKEDEIGPHTKSPYRGDTMNSFNTLFGKEKKNGFAPKARTHGLDNKYMKQIKNFHKNYHTIGNFVLLPNNKNINGGRATFGDYFDLFLLEIMYIKDINEQKLKEEQKLVGQDKEKRKWFRLRLLENTFYKKYSMNQIKNLFFLDDYFNKEGEVEFIKIPKEIRFKKNKEKDEYKKLVSEFISKSENVIANRSDKIIEVLKLEIAEAEKLGIQ